MALQDDIRIEAYHCIVFDYLQLFSYRPLSSTLKYSEKSVWTRSKKRKKRVRLAVSNASTRRTKQLNYNVYYWRLPNTHIQSTNILRAIDETMCCPIRQISLVHNDVHCYRLEQQLFYTPSSHPLSLNPIIINDQRLSLSLSLFTSVYLYYVYGVRFVRQTPKSTVERKLT